MHLSFLGFLSHSTLVIDSELDKAGHVILHLQMRKSRPNGVNQPAKVRPVQFPATGGLGVVESVSMNSGRTGRGRAIYWKLLLTFDPESGQSAPWPLRELTTAPRFPVPRCCPKADGSERAEELSATEQTSHRILALDRPLPSEPVLLSTGQRRQKQPACLLPSSASSKGACEGIAASADLSICCPWLSLSDIALRALKPEAADK